MISNKFWCLSNSRSSFSINQFYALNLQAFLFYLAVLFQELVSYTNSGVGASRRHWAYIQRIPWRAPEVARCKSTHAAVPDADSTMSSSLKKKSSNSRFPVVRINWALANWELPWRLKLSHNFHIPPFVNRVLCGASHSKDLLKNCLCDTLWEPTLASH